MIGNFELSSKPRRRIVVVGGGISGLAAAHKLIEHARTHDPALEVLLLESSSRPGGTVRTYEREGFLLEGGPDAFISEKPEALALSKQLGLETRLLETNAAHRRSFIVRGGRLRPVPEGFQLLAPSRFWPFVTTDIFSWAGKARMALELFLPRRANAAQGGEVDDESLAQFVRRRFGREALERMAQPMVGGIYTADPEQLSLRATMPRYLEMERNHRSVIRAMWRARRRSSTAADETRSTSGARYSLFLSFDGGMQTLTDRLAHELPHGTARLNTRVEAIKFDVQTGRWKLRVSANNTAGEAAASVSTSEKEATRAVEIIEADGVCLALPAYASAQLLGDVDASLAAELDSIPYASTATVNLAFRRDSIPHALEGFGFVVPYIERRKVIACTFSSVKFAGRAPEGYALLRAFVGGALQPEMYALDEDEMLAAVREDLRALLGIEHAPLFAHVEKWPRSMAQYHLGHLARVARIRAHLRRFPSLQLAGNAYGGAGLPDCIRSGHVAADGLWRAVNKT
ncbi:MAG TPA: protoporphyrinogen oxidase [Pyrinomonadaceae bacterium]|nr:protoporphyrinogen oxidase [Pyrinomonadaceae bacterium]